MPRQQAWKLSFACFAAVFFAQYQPLANAQALPDAPRPQTGGEWGQVGIPVSGFLGNSGIQPFMDPIEIKSGFEANLIEKDIINQIQAGTPYVFSNITATRSGEAKLDEFRGKALSLEELNKLAEVLQKSCLDDGQFCQIKMERVSDPNNQNNTLKITQTPMVINKVNISGQRFFRPTILKYLLGVKENKPLNPKTLEKKLRLLQDNPDLSVETTLEPVELNDDKVNLNLKVEDKLPVHVSSFWGNLDQSFYGQHLTASGVIINNATGLNDTLMATAITDARVHGVYTHYEVPVNSHGTRLGVEYSFLKATPNGKDYTPYKIRGDIWSISPGIYQTLIAKENLRLSADLNMDFRQVRTTAYRNTTIEREQIRDIRLGFNFSEGGEKHELSIRQEFTAGLPIMGATHNDSPDLGNTGGGSQFFKYIGSFYFLRQLPLSMAAVLNGTVQYSPWTLPSTDVGGLGGTYFGRGYTEGVLQADSFIFTSAELHFPAFMIPKSAKLPMTDISLRDSVRLLTFVDYGTAYINDKNITNNQSQQILSVGVGTRVEFSKYLSGRCDLGVPLIRHEGVPYHARIHFGLQANVL